MVADKFVRLEIPRSVEEQMIIYATLRRIRYASEAAQSEARALVADVAGEWGKALWAFLTTRASYEQIIQKYRVPEGKLKAMRREVYTRWRL